MLHHFHDKEPIGEVMQEMINDSAALKALNGDSSTKNAKDELKWKPRLKTIMVTMLLFFIILYLVCSLLATYLVQKHYVAEFEKNTNIVGEHLALVLENAIEEKGIDYCNNNMSYYVNSIYDWNETTDKYQYFSATICDSNGNPIASTGRYLTLEVEGITYYFPLEDYFTETEIDELMNRALSPDEYRVEATIASKTNCLVSLELKLFDFITPLKTVWTWENAEANSFAQEELISFTKSVSVKEILSIPYFNRLSFYEEWLRDGIISKKEDEYMQKLSYEETSYWIVVRSSGHTWKAAAELLMPVYLIGFVLVLISCAFTIFGFNRLRKR